MFFRDSYVVEVQRALRIDLTAQQTTPAVNAGGLGMLRHVFAHNRDVHLLRFPPGGFDRFEEGGSAEGQRPAEWRAQGLGHQHLSAPNA